MKHTVYFILSQTLRTLFVDRVIILLHVLSVWGIKTSSCFRMLRVMFCVITLFSGDRGAEYVTNN